MSPSLQRASREPLVHFLVVGALLAVVDHYSSRSSTSETSRVIVVDEGVRRELADAYEHEHGAAPTAAELTPLVDRWVDEEVLYREGLARGLDQGDARIRQRVASLMASLVESQHPIADPTEEEIREYFDAHAERWSEDARIDFVHVFVEGTDDAARPRADELLAQLTAGASPIGLGDSFSGGRHYRGRRLADLEDAFGATFVEGLDTQPVDTWALHTSRFGLHLVRVERRTAASAADFERARLDVEHELLEERHTERAERAIAELRDRWEVVSR